MPDRCSIPECRAISNRINGKLSMFRLPKDAVLRAKWLKSMGKKDWNPAEKAVICERHFEPSCISKKLGEDGPLDKNGRRLKSKIILGSLPTILVPPGTPVLPVQERVRRRRRGKNKKLLEGRRRRGRKKNVEDLDSMPLQQRLTAISSAQQADPEPEKPVQTLKSQPLSPTKLKVTRQSASKPQQQQQKAAAEVQEPVKEEICLKWNTHHSNMQTAFPALLNKEQYCDVTLVAGGQSLKCHKLILSSCSSYFDEVLEKVVPYQHPIIFMKDIPFNIMKALCDFMYVGEVNIVQSDLDQILAVGDSLKIKGLATRSYVKGASTEDVNSASGSETQKIPVKQSKAGSKAALSDKNVPDDDVDITDPLDLMEPTYEEAATPDIPNPVVKRNDQARKSTGRRVRKRKHVEVDHEPSPPVFRLRKGTRSRPNVKVPRYFNANFDNSAPERPPEPPAYSEMLDPEESYIDSYMNILEHIKTEPLDIEDGLISFEEDSLNVETSNAETEQSEAAPRSEDAQKVVKKRKLSKTGVRAKLENPDPLRVADQVSENRRITGETCERVESREEGTEERLDHNDLGDSIEEEGRDDTRVETSETHGMHIENSDRELENYEKEEMQIENTEDINTENVEKDVIDTENTNRQGDIENIEIQVETDHETVMNIENNEVENDTSVMNKIVENESENSDAQNFDEVSSINQIEIDQEHDVQNLNHETVVDNPIGEEENVEGEIEKEELPVENCCHEIRIENSYTDSQAGVCEYEEMPEREDDSEGNGQEDSVCVEEQSTLIPEIINEATTEFDECNKEMGDIVEASTEEKSNEDKTQKNDTSQEGISINSTTEGESNNS